MTNIPKNIEAAIRRDKPIEIDGLTFYPVLMDELEDFSAVRQCFDFMQQRLPVQYAVMPFLSAVYAYDYDLLSDGQKPSGLFAAALGLLALSLRLSTGDPLVKRCGRFKIATDRNNPRTLLNLKFLVNGEELHTISPLQFTRYRPILAAQNGVELPDETANLDILASEAILREKNAMPLDMNINDAITAVATVAGVDEGEIYGWTIRKFQARRKSIDRILNFIICGVGELSGGVKWKGGNPVPSWCFDRSKSGTPALISANEFFGAQGGAVREKAN